MCYLYLLVFILYCSALARTSSGTSATFTDLRCQIVFLKHGNLYSQRKTKQSPPSTLIQYLNLVSCRDICLKQIIEVSMLCRDICLLNLDLRHKHLPATNKHLCSRYLVQAGLTKNCLALPTICPLI